MEQKIWLNFYFSFFS